MMSRLVAQFSDGPQLTWSDYRYCRHRGCLLAGFSSFAQVTKPVSRALATTSHPKGSN
jgi:hypothetical protein